jgi:hypothetical protein
MHLVKGRSLGYSLTSHPLVCSPITFYLIRCAPRTHPLNRLYCSLGIVSYLIEINATVSIYLIALETINKVSFKVSVVPTLKLIYSKLILEKASWSLVVEASLIY